MFSSGQRHNLQPAQFGWLLATARVLVLASLAAAAFEGPLNASQLSRPKTPADSGV